VPDNVKGLRDVTVSGKESCASAAASVMMRAVFMDDELSQNLSAGQRSDCAGFFFVGTTRIFSSNLPIIEITVIRQ
jgi:hypothetical protein